MNEVDLYQKVGMLEEKLIVRAEKIHALEVRLTDIERALWRIANPVAALEKDAEKDGVILNGHMAVQLSNDANMLKEWAKSALNA